MNLSLIPRNVDNSRLVNGLLSCADSCSAVLLATYPSGVDFFACMREGSILDFVVPAFKNESNLHNSDPMCANLC